MIKVGDLVWVGTRRGRVTAGPYVGPCDMDDQPVSYVQVELDGLDSHPHECRADECVRDATGVVIK